MNTKMTMNYEKITPDRAKTLLETTDRNRRLSEGTVVAYSNDMLAGNWQEDVSSPIAIDSDGILRDGQHRMAAIVKSGIPIKMWVCRNVNPDGLYDVGRARTVSDQMKISCNDLEKVYMSTAAQAVIRFFVLKEKWQRKVTFSEVRDFIYDNHDIFTPFFDGISQQTFAKTGIAIVKIGMFTAYCAGVDMNSLQHFYSVLGTGMSESAEDFPIIAYRNYLLEGVSVHHTSVEEVMRCQFAIYKYMTKSKTKRSKVPYEPIYPIYPEILYKKEA